MVLYYIALAVAVSIVAVVYVQSKKVKVKKVEFPGKIEPVSDDYDWKTKQADQYRPFKSTYHVTMNVGRSSREDWLKIDKTYDRAIDIHKNTMSAHPDTTCMVEKSEGTADAVREMYDYVVDTLVQRYPKYFVADEKDPNIVKNTIRGTTLPRQSSSSSEPRQLLRTLGETVEEDIFVLQYDPSVEEYRLQATTGLAGLGFEWREKVGLKLTDIHDPVPQYRERLQNSMNRYFNRIVPDQWVQRITYGVALGRRDDLYSSGNFNFDASAIDFNNLDYENFVHVRLERQMLTRLPRSGFLGFSIRTYMYPMATIKAEGSGPACADALEAWPDDTAAYKGRHIWGEPVLSYLRGETEEDKEASEKAPLTTSHSTPTAVVA